MEKIILEMNILVIAGLILFLTFLITYRSLPKLIKIIHYKQLMDEPNSRSSHSTKTPNLGGISFYFSAIFSLFIIHYFDASGVSFGIIFGLTILFFTGLKDDLVVLSAETKIMAEMAAIFCLLVSDEFYLNSFVSHYNNNGIIALFSIFFVFFSIVYIINAYNLIDGIDGLAAMLGILISLIFSVLFYQLGMPFFFLLSVTSIGILCGYLPYNLSNKNKIFMGDTGSLIIGFLISIMTVRFLYLDDFQLQQIHIVPANLYFVTFSILFFPTLDVIRVVVIRIFNKRLPFSPDRCHLHHILIDKGLSHKKASFVITILSFLIFIFVYLTNLFANLKYFPFGIFLIAISTFYWLLLLDKNDSARKQRKKLKTFIPKGLYKMEFFIRKKTIILLKNLFFKNLL